MKKPKSHMQEIRLGKEHRLCLACSAGGHLAEMLELRDFFEKYDHFFISFRRPDSEALEEKEKVFFAERPGRGIVNTAKSFFECREIIKRENPEVIISTGADLGFIACLAGKSMGKKIIFIESFCRPFQPSVSGKLAYKFADLFIYQWRDLRKFYPKGVYGGSIF